MGKNHITVRNIKPGSIGDRVSIEKGDMLLSINGNEIGDIIEYKFLISDEDIKLKIRKKSGEEREIHIIKAFYDDMGIEINDPSMDSPKRCHNKCIFCFIDQLPSGMRESLYVKDDDSRLSFLQGNFITLTNMSDDDIDRIIKYRISPINVSVHTTNPELRVRMLNNKNAGNIMDRLKKLADGGINLNCQIVLCPEINDGNELKRTLYDLYSLHPAISHVAVVPVGITRYREKLFSMKEYNTERSKEVIELIKPIQMEFEEKTGEPFARLADEFYLIAGEDFPPYEHYGDFSQLEDGIGMARYFENSVKTSLKFVELDGGGQSFAMITGYLIYDFMRQMANAVEEKLNININVYPVKNEFFGEKIDVAGLLTGRDIISQLKGNIKEKLLLIPKNMLKANDEVFLDGVSIGDIERELGVRIAVCEYTGEDLIEKIEDEVMRCQNL